MNAPVILLHPEDSVAVACEDLGVGLEMEGGQTVREPVPSGHKVALRRVPAGKRVLKFGQTIGYAGTDIEPGVHVHTHNLTVPASSTTHSWSPPKPLEALTTPTTFRGYRRADGRVGTRNYIGVLTTVNCSATVARQIADRARPLLERFGNVDGVVALSHATGCGTAAEGEGIDNLRRTLGGFARHPNFMGVLILALGCEANQLGRLLDTQDLKPGERLRTLGIQEAGGTRRAIEQGVEAVVALAELADAAARSSCPASELTLGLQCGGSDAWSGITANPALGAAADLLVRAGGTVILGETPEIYGAEQLLLQRAASPEVANALLERIAWWEDYVARNGQTLNNNPSPGNLAGGLSTILEKSLGAVAKSGSSPLRQVLRYAEPATERGFVFMDSPGYDPCSVTGEIAAGASLICFTTGRGSVFGAKPVPSLKIASNSLLAERLDEDIDLDAGPIANQEATPAEIGARLFQLMLDTASGQASKSESLGFGDLEFVPWQIGATV
ncbi:MAG: altronate dehydratase family protein [Pseudomonadota bacterium]